MAHIIYYCETCRKTFTLWRGNPIGIPFGSLPALTAQVIDHDCNEKEEAA